MNINPFSPTDTDRFSLWEMLVSKDIKAFVNVNWDMIAEDFIEDNFMGIDAGYLGNPDGWKLNFPTLDTYREAWLKQAESYKKISWQQDPLEALFKITTLRDIEIRGDSALVHKKFFGSLIKSNGDSVPANWQTLYRCKKINGKWKIAGFTGYMPHFMGIELQGPFQAKKIPKGASQHSSAGPYSPVLVIDPKQLVVISGQAAIDQQGNVIGEDIEQQAMFTLENCKRQLAIAGCTLNDAFKVNVYMKDLSDWPRFNEIYKQYFSEPLPVRTAVQTGLLMTLLVEIEIWAVKS